MQNDVHRRKPRLRRGGTKATRYVLGSCREVECRVIMLVMRAVSSPILPSASRRIAVGPPGSELQPVLRRLTIGERRLSFSSCSSLTCTNASWDGTRQCGSARTSSRVYVPRAGRRAVHNETPSARKEKLDGWVIRSVESKSITAF